MNDEEFIKLDDFLKANSFQSVRGLIAVENAWVHKPLAQLKRSLEEDIETVQFQTPSSMGSMSASVAGSMSSRDPFRDLGIPPPSPVLSRSPSPAPPPKRRKRKPSPRSQPDLVLGMIAEGEEFDDMDIPPEVRLNQKVSEFQAVSPPLALMPPPDRYVSGTGHPLSDPRYPTGDDFVSYSDVARDHPPPKETA